MKIGGLPSGRTVLKRILYALAEVATLGRGVARTINVETVRLPVRWSRYYPNDYEPAKQRFLEEHAGGTVLDLGAHIGLYTVMLARRAQHVHAFEPTEGTRRALRRTLRLNHCHNVTVHEEAVARESGSLIFHDTGTFISNANSVAAIPASTNYQVAAVAIDDLGLTEVNFIKMDIEGAEFDALLGARRTLETVRAVALEVHPYQLGLLGRSADGLWELLTDAGGHVAINGSLTDRSDFVSRTDCFEVQVTFRS